MCECLCIHLCVGVCMCMLCVCLCGCVKVDFVSVVQTVCCFAVNTLVALMWCGMCLAGHDVTQHI